MDIEISVIIPTFNRKHVVSNSIDSVLSQNEEGVEIVVVDDVSTDGTTEFIKKEYKNIILVELEKNSGQNVARNRGASVASGEWLLFLDSDDTLTNGSLRHLKDLLKKVTSDIIFSACIDSDGKITSNNPNFEGYLSYKKYICGEIKGEYLPMVKRETFLKCLFDETTRRAPGIGHARVIKMSGNAYFTNFVARNYDTKISDSLTKQKKRNYAEMSKVWSIILKEQGLDMISASIKVFFISLAKYCYYKFFSLVRK
ncbi:glycosyltransferase family 2 protein [Campylobacter concisus]|uniref:glycosyltransferase family 2 protein n=1 Tax=Campylobacter concisus TaxID=199 RepID=UPI0015E1764E|nr:glycosyltransferase family 2 protein [Campylobacter concisus]